MKLILYFMLICSLLGYSSQNNELIGQVKSVKHFTPIICPEYDEVDISLGVMQNGVGSMSRQDVRLFIQTVSDVNVLKTANAKGSLVRIDYDERRVAICRTDNEVTKVTILGSK